MLRITNMNRLVFLISMLFCMTFSAQAQELNDSVERRLVQPSRVFFVPHWYLKAQGGASYDVGEAKFSQLGKLILQEIFSQETVSCFLCFIFPSCLCSKTMIVTPVLCSDLVDRFQQCLHIQMGVYPFRQRHRI